MLSCLSRKATDPTRKATTVTIQERAFNNGGGIIFKTSI